MLFRFNFISHLKIIQKLRLSIRNHPCSFLHQEIKRKKEKEKREERRRPFICFQVNVFICLIRNNCKSNLFESSRSIFQCTSPSLTTDLLNLKLLGWALAGMCVTEKFSPFKNHCFGCCSQVKSDHKREHTKNKTNHNVERLCNISNQNCSTILCLLLME